MRLRLAGLCRLRQNSPAQGSAPKGIQPSCQVMQSFPSQELLHDSSLLFQRPIFLPSLSHCNFDSYFTWRMEIFPKDAHRLLLTKSTNDLHLPGASSLFYWTKRGPGLSLGSGRSFHLCSLLYDLASSFLFSLPTSLIKL